MNRFFKVSMVFLLAMVVSMAVMAEGCGGGCCLKMKNVKVALTNIDNGVTITYTTECPKAKQALEAKLTGCIDVKACEMCGMRGVKREFKMTETGAVMTLTAKNSKKVKMLQDKAAEEVSGKGCAGAAAKGCSKDQQRKCAASQGK
ncbi:MAG TPA: hypothetical protein PK747_07250 [Acidobacteriota bacterium]|nr:hypothetical protein [Acidobacteriota bacterium]HQO18869.1 hypothetical protein [Acidobacteriota bacterium]HQQ47189.1 hypothetical protein [Acidobacteriota bacterium]